MKEYTRYRRELTQDEVNHIISVIRDKNLSYMKRVTLRLKLFLDYETPVILPDTMIQGLRTIISFPDIYDDEEMNEIKRNHYVHEKGQVTNLAWDVYNVLNEGLEGRRKRLMTGSKSDSEFVEYTNETIDIAINFADKYASAIELSGNVPHGEMLRRVIRYGAETTHEALQLFRILHFILWTSGCYHNTVGRFDQWLYPFYVNDIKSGKTDAEIFTLIKDFFMSFNRDSDLYYGMTMGDNGQSLVIGGTVNELTYMVLRASLELRQIDPKINLRVNKLTPIELYELATELTKIGLGFPQYSNDDIVIPCLESWGYSTDDAHNYATAACWEFIIPGVSMDIPNINGMSVAEITHNCIINHLRECTSTAELMAYIKTALCNKAVEMAEAVKNIYIEPTPYMSLLMSDCLDNGRDISCGAKYNNYGFHGTGLSCAADQIAAVDSLIFKQKKITVERLLNGLNTNFETDVELRYMLRNNADKMGRDENADRIGNELLGLFAKCTDGLKNERGGIFRTGTGSAMYYVWHSENLQATADGRDKGAYLPANYSPSLFLKNSTPLSILKGFASSELVNCCNGGPVTLELHDMVFKDAESVKKVASIVRTYILLGGHQLQLNAVNREKLLEAQSDPEKYADLIVRVWGWSGHFVEIDKCYQDQIIARTEYNL
jgi:Pyruvate-formate lyase